MHDEMSSPSDGPPSPSDGPSSLLVVWSVGRMVRWSYGRGGLVVRRSVRRSVRWSMSDGLRQMVHPMVHVRWFASDGLRQMVRIRWSASDGPHQMVRIRWSASDGPHQMVRIRWSASDGPCQMVRGQMVCVSNSMAAGGFTHPLMSDGPSCLSDGPTVRVRWSVSDGLREQCSACWLAASRARWRRMVRPACQTVQRSVSDGPCQMVCASSSMPSASFTRPLTSDGPSCLSDGPTVRVRWSVVRWSIQSSIRWSLWAAAGFTRPLMSDGPTDRVRWSVSDGLREQQHAGWQLHAPADVGWSVLPVRRSNGPCQMVHVRWSARAAACRPAASRARWCPRSRAAGGSPRTACASPALARACHARPARASRAAGTRAGRRAPAPAPRAATSCWRARTPGSRRAGRQAATRASRGSTPAAPVTGQPNFNWIATASHDYVGNPGRHRTRKPMAYRVSCCTHSPHLNIPRSFKIVIYLILEHVCTSSINTFPWQSIPFIYRSLRKMHTFLLLAQTKRLASRSASNKKTQYRSKSLIKIR